MLSSRLPLLLALFLVDCGGDDDDGSSCGVLTGTYVDHEVRDSSNPGTCAPDTDDTPATLTIVDHGDGTADILFSQLSGSCPGVVNGCQLTTKCNFTNASGASVASVQLSLSFTSTGYSGYLAGSLPDGKGGMCTANYNTTAVKK